MKRMLIGLLAALLTLPALAERKHSVGEYDIHYIAFNSGFLQPDIAAAAGLVRSKTQGVVNVSVVKDGKPVAAQVSGQVKNLLGQDRQLTFKQLKEGDEAIYYLAQFPLLPGNPALPPHRAADRRAAVQFRVQPGILPRPMMPFSELVLASHNAGKLKELQAMLGDAVRVRSVAEFSTVEPEETGLSFIENAILKARNAARISGLPALADDSGLAVDALGGAPGIYSARYADGQGDAANNAKLLQVLRDVPDAERGAQFVCALALVRHADDPLPIICEGLWHGRILHAPRGEHGFGYDPLFWVPECDCSSAELPAAQKNQLSHRARAMALLKQRLGI